MVKIKCIFFDLFGVLLGMNQSTTITISPKKIKLPYLETKDIVMGEVLMRLKRREINFRQYFHNIQYALPNGEIFKLMMSLKECG